MILEGLEMGRPVWIVGAGSTLRELDPKDFKYRITIGINNMVDFVVPTYHLWTNKQRWSTFGHRIDSRSRMVFGDKMPHDLIRKHFSGSYLKVAYIDEKGMGIGYGNGIIKGHFRTAGCLAIMMAFVMGASEINIVGMDGYTLGGKKDTQEGRASQHCYGNGHTDDADWQDCLKKDELVRGVLDSIRDYGVSFRIMTPTVFKEHTDAKT